MPVLCHDTSLTLGGLDSSYLAVPPASFATLPDAIVISENDGIRAAALCHAHQSGGLKDKSPPTPARAGGLECREPAGSGLVCHASHLSSLALASADSESADTLSPRSVSAGLVPADSVPADSVPADPVPAEAACCLGGDWEAGLGAGACCDSGAGLDVGSGFDVGAGCGCSQEGRRLAGASRFEAWKSPAWYSQEEYSTGVCTLKPCLPWCLTRYIA